MRVYKEEEWMPRFSDIRKKALPRPPMKSLILKAIQDELKVHPVLKNAKFAVTKASVVNKEWLIDLLASLNYDHPYFAPGYAPEPHEKVEQPDTEIMVNDP